MGHMTVITSGTPRHPGSVFSTDIEDAVKRVFVLPFRGEFGIKLLRHVCRVHGIRHSRKIVVCEPGDEALFPSAESYVICTPNDDDRRREMPRDDSLFTKAAMSQIVVPLMEPGDGVVWPLFDGPRAYFTPIPHVSPDPHPDWDIIVCPRLRRYGMTKNWLHWTALVEMFLSRTDLKVAAAGARESSDLALERDVSCAWAGDRPLDRTISWMRRAKLVIATDTGLAHLAVWCGRPLLLISHLDGMVAPGPVIDDRGRVLEQQYWPINLSQYASENHLNSSISVVDHAWSDPARVFHAALRLLEV